MNKVALPKHLAVVVVAVAALAAGCERRPRDPKPPSDPGRSVPKPITATPSVGVAAPAIR